MAAVLPAAFNPEYEITYRVHIIAYIDGSFCLAATIICAILYAAIMVILSRSKQNVVSNNSLHAEIRLLLCAIIEFLVLTLNAIAQILSIIMADNLSIVDIINDITTILHAPHLKQLVENPLCANFMTSPRQQSLKSREGKRMKCVQL
ncbi:unnamed protein product [Anisakis simplex]|uniref:G protein-coupled receptor n=1 Tax=Anisakis simplex TaxID=6269 RepID=A0A0M3KEB7_ANISI|nr:unnamed protein product [Anisakis simplex]